MAFKEKLQWLQTWVKEIARLFEQENFTYENLICFRI